MKPTVTLINALRHAADDILTSPSYKWSLPRLCNCGFLARAVCGPVPIDVSGTWTETADHVARCSVTGQPIPEVFAGLLKAGLELKDLQYIENLDSSEVLVRLDWNYQERYEPWSDGDKWKSLRCSDRQSVAAYFRAQADILEEQLGNAFEDRPLTLTPAKEQVSA